SIVLLASGINKLKVLSNDDFEPPEATTNYNELPEDNTNDTSGATTNDLLEATTNNLPGAPTTNKLLQPQTRNVLSEIEL
ncbi:11794_t:CDS:1, partial [Racocetra persica]